MQLKLIFLSFLLSIVLFAQSQTTNINFSGLDECFRRDQLLGKADSYLSNSTRPYAQSLYDSAFKKSNSAIDRFLESAAKKKINIVNSLFYPLSSINNTIPPILMVLMTGA